VFAVPELELDQIEISGRCSQAEDQNAVGKTSSTERIIPVKSFASITALTNFPPVPALPV
jgi:hypothetical protein